MASESTAQSPATTAFRGARDQLLELNGQHERAVQEFRWPDVGPSFNFAIDWFDANARGNDAPALTIVEEGQEDQPHVTTFDEMATASDQVAAFLKEQGIGRGDSVIVMLGNQVELWQSMLGIIKLGAVLMPTTTAVGAADLADRIERGDAKGVITNESEIHKFAELDLPEGFVKVFVPGKPGTSAGDDTTGWVDLRTAYELDVPPAEHPGNASDDRLLLYFTSGTTSRPKLVEHTHTSYPVGHLSTMFWLGLRPGDTHLNISSPGWAKHAWSCFFAPWIAQAGIFIYNYSRFDAARMMSVLGDNGVTSLCAPPTVWRMMINADLSGGKGSLREVIGAGEPLNPEVIEKVRDAWGLTLRDGFGQTEMTAVVGNTPGSEVRPGSMGRPLPGCPVVIVDPVTSEPAAVEEDGTREGEICLDLSANPLPLMTGYWGDPERNAEAMAGGYYHTGDVASQDKDGYITYVGRTDDVFKASDYKISPFELESVLIEHPAVAEAAVVPAPDEVRLAVPKAYISLAPGHEAGDEVAESILKHARERLAPWQRVRRIEFFELPKTISGKIRRVELRGREQQLARGEQPATTGKEWRDSDFPSLKG